MHIAAARWFALFATDEPVTVLDIGGRNINGTTQIHFPNADFTTLDILPGADILADAATWTPDRQRDLVLAAEVFEHAERWREICGTAFAALVPGGEFVCSMAGPGRPEHSGVDGGPLRPGEYYGNVDPDDLRATLSDVGFADVTVHNFGFDVWGYGSRRDW